MNYGYAGEILKIDLSTGKTSILETAAYADRFLGGRGVAAKLYWDEAPADAAAFGEENCLIFITGPMAGFTGFAGCRWLVCGKSPVMQPESFSYANFGGSWGSWLKYAGYDGLVVKGIADKPVYLIIDNGALGIRDASRLWGKTTVDTQAMLQEEHGKQARVLSIGPAAENRVVFATILASENASGSSGFGAVMGSKNLKAIVVKADEKKRPLAADPEKLKLLAQQVYRLRTTNFEDYGHILPLKTRFTACYGCISGCTRGTYEAENGMKFKALCQAMGVYQGPAMRYYGDKAEDVIRMATRLCDKFGLDTAVLSPLIDWLGACYKQGILSDEETGLPLSKFGSGEFIEKLVDMISCRKGFGEMLARGPWKAAEHVGKGSDKLLNAVAITRAGETRDYDPRIMLNNAMIYATEPRRPIHLLHATSLPLKRWLNWMEGWKDAFLTTQFLHDLAVNMWGSEDAFDLTGYQGKALASKKIQNYGYVKESMALCDLAWPIYQVHTSADNTSPYTLESRMVSAVTGRKVDEAEMEKTGERNFNMQRAVLMRQGWGGRTGDNIMGYLFKEPFPGSFFDPKGLVPDSKGTPVSRIGAMMDRSGFERLKDDYYSLRGWDVESGMQTTAKLEELGMGDIAGELEKMKLAVRTS